MDQGSGGQSRGQKGAFGPRGASAACPRQWDGGSSWANLSVRVGGGEVGGASEEEQGFPSASAAGQGVLQRSKISKEFAVFLQNSSKAESELHGPSGWIYFSPPKCGTVSAVSEEFHSWEGTENCSMIFMSSRKNNMFKHMGQR